MHNASSVDFDQTKAMENADAIISMLENDELNTGKWQQWFKDTTGITTRADGTLGAAATENLIKQINSATFGALSEKEIEQLMQTFAQGGQTAGVQPRHHGHGEKAENCSRKAHQRHAACC